MVSVLKFGGSSLKDEASRQKVANIIKGIEGKVVVVVSAIGRYPDAYATDTLRSLISAKVTITESNRLLSVGEIISSVILADELLQNDIKAISLSSIQAGLKVKNHRLVDLHVKNIKKKLETYDVVIVPGFQGIDEDGEISILESGDSDYSAVYIAKQLGLNRVYLYSDVCGIYTGDPKYIISARLISHVSYEQAMDLAKHKARIICQKALEEGSQEYGFKIYLCSTFIPNCHTCIDHSETHIKTMSIDFNYWQISFDEDIKEPDKKLLFEEIGTNKFMIQACNLPELTTKYTKVEEYVKVHFVGCYLENDEIYRVFLEQFCQKSFCEENSYYIYNKNQKQDITLLHDIIVKEE